MSGCLAQEELEYLDDSDLDCYPNIKRYCSKYKFNRTMFNADIMRLMAVLNVSNISELENAITVLTWLNFKLM